MPIGKLTNFDLDTGSWTTYTDRLQQYFVVNDVKPEMRVPTLIACVDDATYELMVELCSPKKLVNIAFKDLVSIVKKHLEPAPLILEERCIFRKRMQQENESVIKYAEILKNLARTCNFHENYDENLRDQFVCGLKNEAMKQMLFSEGNLNFALALNKAAALESMMELHMKEMRTPTLELVVSNVKQRQQKYNTRVTEKRSSKKNNCSCCYNDKKHSTDLFKATRDIEQVTDTPAKRDKRDRRLTQRYGIDYSVTYNFKSYLNNVLDALN